MKSDLDLDAIEARAGRAVMALPVQDRNAHVIVCTDIPALTQALREARRENERLGHIANVVGAVTGPGEPNEDRYNVAYDLVIGQLREAMHEYHASLSSEADHD